MNTKPERDADALEQRLRDSRGLEDAPEQVILRIVDLWQRAPRAAAVAVPGLVQRLVAVLDFDSGTASPLAFGRRSGDAATRQLLFSTETNDIDLRIEPAVLPGGDRWVLSGQVLGAEACDHVTVTADGGTPVAEGTISELGEFRLQPLHAGRYTVSLRSARREIELPPFDVPVGS